MAPDFQTTNQESQMYSDRERDRSHVTRNVNGKALQGAKFKHREIDQIRALTT
jgi:hypothetical protein